MFRERIKRGVGWLWPTLPEGKAILVYHSVSDATGSAAATALNTSRFSQSAVQFEEQMRFLLAHRKVVPLADLATGDSVGQRPEIAITFDDGYLDTYTHAFPILSRLSIPFTVFVTTKFVEGDASAFSWSPHYRNLLPLTWEQCREMQRYGVSIGSHTHRHRRLASCSIAELQEELDISTDIAQQRLGTGVDMFAYPFGQPHDYDSRAIRALQNSGYRRAFTTVATCFREVTHIYEVPRVTIDWRDSLTDFAQKVLGKRDYMKTVANIRSTVIKLGLGKPHIKDSVLRADSFSHV